MSKLDARTLWRIIDQAKQRDVAQFRRDMVAGGADVTQFIGEAFAEWAQDARPEEITRALQQIAKAQTPADKRVTSLKIAGVWE
jgi:hypothetical protein